MQSNGKLLCKIFDQEIFLYIDNALPVERKELLREHLKSCENCKKLLLDTENILSISGDITSSDLSDDIFETMIKNTVQKKQNGYWNNFILIEKSRKEKFIHFGKISFASALVIIAVVVSLLSDKPNTIKSVGKDILDWEGEKISSQIDDIKKGIEFIQSQNMNTWDSETDLINRHLEKLEKESDPYSF